MLLGPDRADGRARSQLLGPADAGGGRHARCRRVGALVEGPAFHPYLSGRANLRPAGRRRPATPTRAPAGARIDAALDRVGLLAAASKRYRAYSLGMRQRLAIASALLMPRDLLVLDEPTNGLDPQGTREVRHLIGDLADDGTTVLVSSHLLAEVEQMCSHVGVMYDGRLVAQGPIAELRVRHRARRVRVRHRPARRRRAGADRARPDRRRRSSAASRHRGCSASVARGEDRAALVNAGVPVLGFAVQQPSLEDVFVALDRGGLRCQRLRCWRPPTRAPAADPGPVAAGASCAPSCGSSSAGGATWPAWRVLAVVPIILAIAVRMTSPGGEGGGPDFIGAITGNGLFVAFAALTLELPLFLPLAVGAIAGDSVAGEANLGTLRYLLTIPAGRTRLLVVKYAAIVIFSFAPPPWSRWSARSWAWPCSAAGT